MGSSQLAVEELVEAVQCLLPHQLSIYILLHKLIFLLSRYLLALRFLFLGAGRQVNCRQRH